MSVCRSFYNLCPKYGFYRVNSALNWKLNSFPFVKLDFSKENRSISANLAKLSTVSTTKLTDLFAKLGVEARYLKQHPEIYSIKTEELTRSIKLMREIGLDEDAVIEMLFKHPSLVIKCYKTCKSDLRRFPHHRIEYLAKELTITQKEFCATFPKYKFILSLSFSRIKEVMDVLKSHQVAASDIFSDFWIIRCRASTISDRLEQVANADVDSVRPWMARCKPAIFKNFMSRVSSKQKLLGELSLEEYISKRLECSAVEIKEIIDREPQLQKTSVLKIKKILDFLFASGFSSHDIVSGLPRVANRNIDTIHARLQELSQLGIPPSLYVVCKSKREYQHYVSKWKTRNT